MNTVAVTTLVVVLGFTAALVYLGRPRGASTVDFYLAGRRIGVVTNACAICGDYFSAASFLGVAGAVYASGLDGMWYATGFAAGFVPVLLFIAAPLRRFGEFSIPDFLGRRLESESVRVGAVGVVQLIILTYLVPQAVGSGIIWDLLIGEGAAGLSPYATGVVASSIVITLTVIFGGMRGTTWTQATQFLFKLAVLIGLAVAVYHAGFSYPAAVAQLDETPLRNPAVASEQWELRPVDNRLDADAAASFGEPGSRYGALGQFALVAALVLGTAGLPHVMNRYFTAPSGRAARMTTVWVLGFAGVFYALAVFLGTAARELLLEAAPTTPWLAESTVGGVLLVPEHALLSLGRLLGGFTGLGLVAGGALTAVMSTIAGLLLAAAASWGHDVYERFVNRQATERQALRAARLAVVCAASLAALVALRVEPQSVSTLFPSLIAQMVTWAFVLAGSALTPALVLTIWWKRTTARGVLAGMATGALVSLGLVAVGLALGVRGELQTLLLTPTLVAAPLSVAVTVAVSLRSPAPAEVERHWLQLHGTAADRRAETMARWTLTPPEKVQQR